MLLTLLKIYLIYICPSGPICVKLFFSLFSLNLSLDIPRFEPIVLENCGCANSEIPPDLWNVEWFRDLRPYYCIEDFFLINILLVLCLLTSWSNWSSKSFMSCFGIKDEIAFLRRPPAAFSEMGSSGNFGEVSLFYRPWTKFMISD